MFVNKLMNMFHMKKIASQMKELNHEQRIIVNDILYKKNKNPTKLLQVFLTWDVGTTKTYTLMCIIQTFYNII